MSRPALCAVKAAGCESGSSRSARRTPRETAEVIHFRFPLTFSLICIIHCQHIASPRYVQELSLDVQRMTSFSFFSSIFIPPPSCPRVLVINHQLLLLLLRTHLHHGSERYRPVFPLTRQTSLTSAISSGRGGGGGGGG